MADLTVLKSFTKILNFSIIVLQPFKSGSMIPKKLFIFYVVAHIGLILVCALFCIFKVEEIALTALTNTLAEMLIGVREGIYLLLTTIYRVQLKRILTTIVEDRKAALIDEHHWTMTSKYCAMEILSFKIYFSSFGGSVLFLMTGAVVLLPNEYLLPINFYLVGLPITEIPSVSWVANYALQVFLITLETSLFLTYVPMSILLMSHSCWKVASATIFVKELDDALNHVAALESESQKNLISARLKKVVEMIETATTWQREVTNFLQYSFVAELTLLSTIFCMWIFSFTADYANSAFSMIALAGSLSQLYIYCWMGSRFKHQLDILSATLFGISWDRMEAKHRNDLQLVVLMTQKIKGFHGIFRPIDLATFKAILEFSYSLLVLVFRFAD